MMEKRNIVVFILMLICSVCIFLSQNFGTQGQNVLEFFDWVTYEVTPGNWVHVSFQDSIIGQTLPNLAYMPSITGGIALLAAVLALASVKASKIISIITMVVGLITLFIFMMPSIFLGMFGSSIPFPNLAGAYFCIGPAIGILISAFLLKTKREMGYAKENKDYFAIGDTYTPPPEPIEKGPTTQCPHCGAIVPQDQLFCEQCGEYF